MLMMLLLAHDETATVRSDPPPAPATSTTAIADSDEVYDDWGLYTAALAASGVLVAGAGLEGPGRAHTIRHRAGETFEVDGPFVESKEYLIGFFLLDVADAAEAHRWARRAPAVRDGAVEVREVRPGSETGFSR